MKGIAGLLVVVLMLALAGLACSYPGFEDVGTPEPTTAPTLAPGEAEPDEATPEAPAGLPAGTSAGPQTFNAQGVKNDYGSDGAVCLVYQPVTLTLKGDGAAELSTSGADIIDHSNCTAGATEETWYINGAVDAAAQVVTFESCNFGRFTASGSVSYAGGELSGEVSCTNKDGVKFITLIVGP